MLKKIFSLILIVLLEITMLPCGAADLAENLEVEATPNSLREFLLSARDLNFVWEYDYPAYTSPIAATPEKSKIPARTPIMIKSTYDIDSDKIYSGDNINFKTVVPVTNSDGRVLIEANTPVSAKISFQKSKCIGNPGKLTISDFHVNAVDGTYVPISSTISLEGDDRMTLSIVLSLLICPLFFLMKGENAVLPAGTSKTVYTVTDVFVNP